MLAALCKAWPGVTLTSEPLMAPCGASEAPGDKMPPVARDTNPALKALQLMPARSLSRSCTSTIFASSITWRCTLTRAASRYSATARCSLGMARTMMVPVCAETTTLRPSLSPTKSLMLASNSPQTSLRCCVLTWLDSCELPPPPPPVAWPPADWPEPVLPLEPLEPPPPLPPPLIEPPATRVSLRPARLNEG